MGDDMFCNVSSLAYVRDHGAYVFLKPHRNTKFVVCLLI